MQNFCSKVPEEVWPEIKAEIMAIRDAAGYEQGKQLGPPLKITCNFKTFS